MPSPETNSGSEQPFTPIRSENNGVQTVPRHAPASSSDKHSQSKMGYFLIKWCFLSFKSTNLPEGDKAGGGGQAEVAGRGIIESITLQVSDLDHHPAEVQMPTMKMTMEDRPTTESQPLRARSCRRPDDQLCHHVACHFLASWFLSSSCSSLGCVPKSQVLKAG